MKFMQYLQLRVYTRTLETNHVSRVRTSAAALYLQFMLQVMLFRP